MWVPPVETVEAAAASSSNPLLPAADGENMGIFVSVGVSTVEAPDEGSELGFDEVPPEAVVDPLTGKPVTADVDGVGGRVREVALEPG